MKDIYFYRQYPEAFNKILWCVMQKQGVQEELGVVSEEGWLTWAESKACSYRRFTIETDYFSEEALNHSGYALYDFTDFYTACNCFLECDSWQNRLSLIESMDISWYQETRNIDVEDEGEWEDLLSQIAQCLVAVHKQDMEVLWRFKEKPYALTISVFQYVAGCLKSLAKMLEVPYKNVRKMLPVILPFFTTDSLSEEVVGEVEGIHNGESCWFHHSCGRKLQLFFYDVSFWSALTKEEQEVLQEPLYWEGLGKFTYQFGSTLVIGYTTLDGEVSLLCREDNVNPVALAVMYKLKHQLEAVE